MGAGEGEQRVGGACLGDKPVVFLEVSLGDVASAEVEGDVTPDTWQRGARMAVKACGGKGRGMWYHGQCDEEGMPRGTTTDGKEVRGRCHT